MVGVNCKLYAVMALCLSPVCPSHLLLRLPGFAERFPRPLRGHPPAPRHRWTPVSSRRAALPSALAEEVGAGGPVCSPCALVLYQDNPGAFPTPASRSRGSATPHCCFAACAEMSWGQEPKRGPGGPCVLVPPVALQPVYTGEGGATET